MIASPNIIKVSKIMPINPMLQPNEVLNILYEDRIFWVNRSNKLIFISKNCLANGFDALGYRGRPLK